MTPADRSHDTHRRVGAPAVATLAALGSSAALWSVGWWTTPHPALPAALLAASILLGTALLLSPGPCAGVVVRAAVRIAGALALASASAFVVRLFALPEGPVPVVHRALAAAPAPERLRLVDWNVLHGYPGLRGQEARYRRLAAALRRLDADVIVLQEAWAAPCCGRLADRLGAELEMSVAYAKANGSRRLIGFEEGGAVLSRLPISSARREILEPRRKFWETRIALFVTVALGDGTTLTVVGTHLAAGDRQVAAAQARDLAASLEPGFVIVSGDLNAPSGSAVAAALEARGLTDLVPGGIDHVFLGAAPAPWRVATARFALPPEEHGGDRWISDHPAIVVDLVRGRAADPP